MRLLWVGNRRHYIIISFEIKDANPEVQLGFFEGRRGFKDYFKKFLLRNFKKFLKIPFERKYSTEKDVSKGTFIHKGHFLSPISEILKLH